jgi:hypothetical protein
VDQPWKAISLDLDGHHHVQTENSQVVEVIPVERLGAEMGMHTAQALKATDALADTFKRRDLEAFGIAHHDRFDRAMAADQQSNLAFDFMREFAEIARQLLRDDAFWREATPIQVFEASKLVWL